MDFLYKICKKCKIEKELEQFHKDKKSPDADSLNFFKCFILIKELCLIFVFLYTRYSIH